MKKFILLVFLIFLISGCGKKEYYCDANDTLKGTSCISKHEIDANIVYTCKNHPSTHLNNDQCCYYNSKICLNADISSYTCSSGYLKGKKCIIETTYNAYEK